MTAAATLRVLVVEDEADLADTMRRYFEHQGHTVALARSGIDALRLHLAHPVDVALIDLALQGTDGLAVLRELRRAAQAPECIIITGHGTLSSAVESTRLGAADFVAKPFQFADLHARIEAAVARREHTPADGTDAVARQLGRDSGAMRAIWIRVAEQAHRDVPVLVTGEPGAGQEEVARAIHAMSARATGRLVEACCEELSERGTAELFGTDLRGRRPARAIPLVALAAGGTLMLRGIEALDPAAQEALARELARGDTVHAAGAGPDEACTRILATMSTPLRAAVAAGAVTASLGRVLAAHAIEVPALRTRREDIPTLAAAFVREFGGLHPPVLTDDAVQALVAHHWPCNVMELRQVIERAVATAQGGVVHAHDLPLAPADAPRAGGPLSLGELERRHIGAVLRRVNWHQGRAAQLLGISVKTLYRKIREYGFRRPSAESGP